MKKIDIKKEIHSENQFKALVSSLLMGIFQADAQGNGTYVNEAVCSFTGLSLKKHSIYHD